MRKHFAFIFSCFFAAATLHGQSTIDTVDFKTGVTRILKDYTNNFGNIKDSTCVAACELNIFIPEGGDFHSAVRQKYYAEGKTYASFILYYYDYKDIHSEAVFGPDMDQNSIAIKFEEMKTILLHAYEELFEKIDVYNPNCSYNKEHIDCKYYTLKPLNLNEGDTFVDVDMEMIGKVMIYDKDVIIWTIEVTFTIKTKEE